jgi:hypothetical protein
VQYLHSLRSSPIAASQSSRREFLTYLACDWTTLHLIPPAFVQLPMANAFACASEAAVLPLAKPHGPFLAAA